MDASQTPQAQIKDLTAKLAQMTELAARAQADLQNAKIRMQKDKDELGKFALEGVLKKLLPVIDGFARAFRHLPPDIKNHEWVQGVAAVEQALLRELQGMGLKKMNAAGQADTARHEVLSLGPGKEGEIIEVLEDGYELHGKMLRPAKVKVGDGSPQPRPTA